MDMTGERRIPASREKVFAALNDPAILKACIPGCETLDKITDHDMSASAIVKIGPIAAKFSGTIHISDSVPSEGYRITGEGQGGVAGFANGSADVHLKDEAGITVLSYAVQAQVGGKLAQLGARLIDATAKTMADQFFDRFTTLLSQQAVETKPVLLMEGGEDQIGVPLPPPPPATIGLLSLIPNEVLGLPLVFWIGSAVMAVILVLIYGTTL